MYMYIYGITIQLLSNTKNLLNLGHVNIYLLSSEFVI